MYIMGFNKEEGDLILGCESTPENDGVIVCNPKIRLPDNAVVPIASKPVVVEQREPGVYRLQNDGGMTTKNMERFLKYFKKYSLKE